jgi:AcrR family transcriptional regulator
MQDVFMAHVSPGPEIRQRAPSKRALMARGRIFDAAEKLFAFNGFDGTSVRDIAREAGVPAASVLFHGVSKEALFHAVVARRADEIMAVRLGALDAAITKPGPVTVEAILEACLTPLVDRALNGGPQWMAYVRLVAIVSSDDRWREISRACFDPTAGPFLEALSGLFPDADAGALASAYVYAISATLSLCTAHWRINALAGGADTSAAPQALIRFCAAGMRAVLAPTPMSA